MPASRMLHTASLAVAPVEERPPSMVPKPKSPDAAAFTSASAVHPMVVPGEMAAEAMA